MRSSPWRIVIDVTADTRDAAESAMFWCVRAACVATDDGDALELDADATDRLATMECGDPGLAHRPQDADLSIAGEGDPAGEAVADAQSDTARAWACLETAAWEYRDAHDADCAPHLMLRHAFDALTASFIVRSHKP